jgi:hypothetical protein
LPDSSVPPDFYAIPFDKSKEYYTDIRTKNYIAMKLRLEVCTKKESTVMLYFYGVSEDNKTIPEQLVSVDLMEVGFDHSGITTKYIHMTFTLTETDDVYSYDTSTYFSGYLANETGLHERFDYYIKSGKKECSNCETVNGTYCLKIPSNTTIHRLLTPQTVLSPL